jgi:multidrug resistance efflux pump
MNDEKTIELKSPAVQELLGRPPRWVIRWGITIIFMIVAGLVAGSYFFKYPDIIPATITVTTENLPAGIMTKTTGRIDTLFVTERQQVKQGDLLAVLENTANWQDVLALKEIVKCYISDSRDDRDSRRQKARKQKAESETQNAEKKENAESEHGESMNMENGMQNIENGMRVESVLPSAFAPSTLKPSAFAPSAFSALHLGELQPVYQQFIKAHEDYLYFIHTDYHRRKIAVIEKQIRIQRAILQKSQHQISLNAQQLSIVYQSFVTDSILYAKKALSGTEYQNAKNSYLQQLQSFENAKLGIDNQNMSILQSEQTIFDLEQQRSEQLNNLQISLTGALEQLQTQIKQWEQTYLLVSPIDGVVTLTKYWQKNQNINAGEVLVTVVPDEQTKIAGKILLPPQGAGKVKEGQMVNVKFDNFPYMEFGMVRVQIKNISLVPVVVGDNQKAYMLEVDFPNQLKTNYGKALTFSQEMTGSAEIITEDLRLLDKFLNPIRAVIKK